MGFLGDLAQIALPAAGFAFGGPVGGMIGSAAGGMIGQSAQNSQSRSNSDHAFNQSMYASNTAHEREVADLRNAGLNPILSANAGASAPQSSPAQAAPQISLPDIIRTKQADIQLEQGQQRLNIDKANSAASIAKTLSDAELIKAKTLTEKSGAFGRYFGAGPVDYFTNPQGSFRKGIKLQNQHFTDPKSNFQRTIPIGGMK